MWYKKIATGLVIIIFIITITIPVVSAGEIASEPAVLKTIDYRSNLSFNEITHPDMDVKILTDDISKVEARSQNFDHLTLSVNFLTLNDIDQILPEDILFIEEDVSDYLENVELELIDKILQGTPVILMSKNPDPLMNLLDKYNLSHGYGEGNFIFAYQYNPQSGETYCFGVGGEPSKIRNGGIDEAYNWASYVQENMNPQPMVYATLSTPYWGNTLNTWQNYHPDQGDYNIRTVYDQLLDDGSSTYNYYRADYFAQTVPDESKSTSDIVVLSYVQYSSTTQNIYRYNPTTTSGVSTVGVNLGFSYTADGGLGVSISTSWFYAVPDVFIHDNSNLGIEKLDWWHDVREDYAVGHDTYFVEPGAIFQSQDSHLHIRD